MAVIRSHSISGAMLSIGEGIAYIALHVHSRMIVMPLSCAAGLSFQALIGIDLLARGVLRAIPMQAELITKVLR